MSRPFDETGTSAAGAGGVDREGGADACVDAGARQPLGQEDVRRLQECVAGGGVAVFPTDTVYGLCCDPDDELAARRLYELKGRPANRPSAVMFFQLEAVWRVLPELTACERAALQALLPGPVTVLLLNRASRFTPACGPNPTTLGLRVPRLPGHLGALCTMARPVMQSSANISGAGEARRLADVPESLCVGADLVLDGGELAGVASTVLDLREYERARTWRIVREGPLGRDELQRALRSC